MSPMTFGFRALESYRAAVVKVGHLTIPFPIHTGSSELPFEKKTFRSLSRFKGKPKQISALSYTLSKKKHRFIYIQEVDGFKNCRTTNATCGDDPDQLVFFRKG